MRRLLKSSGRLSLLAGLVCLLTHCAWRSADVVSYHTFTYPAPSKHATSPTPETLMVYQFLLGPSVDTDYLVISESEGKDKPMALHRWRENPADMITELIRRDVGNSGLFRRTVDQFSNLPYRYALEGTVRHLQGRVGKGKALAVVELEALLVDFEAPPGMNKNVLKKVFKAEVPSKDSSPKAIVTALNEGVMAISAQLRNDIRSALKK